MNWIKKAGSDISVGDAVKLIQEGYPVRIYSVGNVVSFKDENDVVVNFADSFKELTVTKEHLQKL